MPSSGAKCNGYQRQKCRSVTDDEDGPQPMRDFKPSKTKPNSANQFEQSHQAEYEARGKRSTDDMEWVQHHYAAYPVLRDELDKRRSATRVTAVKARRDVPCDSICSACLKLRRRKMRKNTLRSRCQGRRNRPYKAKERPYRSSRCVRDIYRNKAVGKYKRGSRARGVASPREGSVERSFNGNKSRSDVGSLKNPSTAERSVSSYHSFPSIDHEPMV